MEHVFDAVVHDHHTVHVQVHVRSRETQCVVVVVHLRRLLPFCSACPRAPMDRDGFTWVEEQSSSSALPPVEAPGETPGETPGVVLSWAILVARLRRLARLRRIWGILGQFLRQIKDRGRA